MIKEKSDGVQIAAAGNDTRLRDFMDLAGYKLNFPKHLLPTGNVDGETPLAYRFYLQE